MESRDEQSADETVTKTVAETVNETENVETDQQPTENVEEPSISRTPDEETKKIRSKRKRKVHTVVEQQQPGVPESEYGYRLEIGGADVLPQEENVDSKQESEAGPNVAASIHAQLNAGVEGFVSQPSDKVYIQETYGFRRTEREEYEKYMNERHRVGAEFDKEGILSSTNVEAIQTGIVCQSFFRTFALILQGVIAGFSTAHCLLVIFLTPPHFSNLDFVKHYAILAMPLHCFYYVIFVVCSVAVLDRYDINRGFLRVLFRALTFQSGGLSVVMYLTLVALNAVCLPVEERMTLYLHNATSLYGPINSPNIQPTEAPDLNYDLYNWKALLIARAVLAILSWFLVALRPTTDLLSKHMRKAGEEFSQISVAPTVITETATPAGVVVSNTA